MPLIDQVAEQEQEAAKARGDLPEKQCRLDQLQGKLDNPDPALVAKLSQKSDDYLQTSLTNMQRIINRLEDGGEKSQDYCTAVRFVLERREDQRKKEKSQIWREQVSFSPEGVEALTVTVSNQSQMLACCVQAKVNQAVYNSEQAAEVAGPAVYTSRPEPDCQVN